MNSREGAKRDWARLGGAIRRARKQRGLTQEELAQAAALDRKTIGNYEAGRVPALERVPDGYYQVADVFSWDRGVVERYLDAGDTGLDVEGVLLDGSRIAVQFKATAAGEAITLYPTVVAFARACAREGADSHLRDLFEEAAERLLQSIPAGQPSTEEYGLAAYRPHAWAEGDTGVPADDAETIARAIDEYRRGNPGHRGE